MIHSEVFTRHTLVIWMFLGSLRKVCRGRVQPQCSLRWGCDKKQVSTGLGGYNSSSSILALQANGVRGQKHCSEQGTVSGAQGSHPAGARPLVGSLRKQQGLLSTCTAVLPSWWWATCTQEKKWSLKLPKRVKKNISPFPDIYCFFCFQSKLLTWRKNHKWINEEGRANQKLNRKTRREPSSHMHGNVQGIGELI